jgi:hypothetical protein
MSVPLGVVPGEVPIPVTLTMGANYKVTEKIVETGYGLSVTAMGQGISAKCGFGGIGIANEPNGPGTYLVLENGESFGSNEFIADATQGNLLFNAWGFSSVLTHSISSDGALLWATYDTYSTDPGVLPFTYQSLVQQHLPVGLTFTQQRTLSPGNTIPFCRYDLVADKNLLRVFVEGSDGTAYPILWADRFNHYVTFQWTFVRSGLPQGMSAITKVEAVNQRGQGAVIRFGDWKEPFLACGTDRFISPATVWKPRAL